MIAPARITPLMYFLAATAASFATAAWMYFNPPAIVEIENPVTVVDSSQMIEPSNAPPLEGASKGGFVGETKADAALKTF